VVNDLLIRVKGIFQRLRSRLSALLSTPEQPQPSVEEKPKESSLYSNPKELLKRRAVSVKKAKVKRKK